jgi:glyoxylate reductase
VSDERWPVLVTRRLPKGPMDAIRARTDAEVWDDESAIPREELLRRVAGKRGAVTLLTERVDDEFLDAAGPDLLI